ncbi:MAG TPA: hypothetical protein VGA89_02315 [Patescibacteria group bacterium]
MTKISPADITLETLTAGQFQAEFPAFYDLKKVVENSTYHDQQNVYDHTIAVLRGLTKLFQLDFVQPTRSPKLQAYLAEKPVKVTRQTLIFLATVFHDLTKEAVLIEVAPGKFSAPGHELLAVGIAKNYLAKTALTEADIVWICDFIEAHGYVHSLIDVKLKRTDRDFFILFQETMGDSAVGLLFFVYADLLGSDLQKTEKQTYQARVKAVEEMIDWAVL